MSTVRSSSISIHALLAESDLAKIVKMLNIALFLSTLSLRRATRWYIYNGLCRIFLSTLSLRRATDFGLVGQRRNVISIHALLAESDSLRRVAICLGLIFLSTLSLRRATSLNQVMLPWKDYFYPRSPCGERPLNGGRSPTGSAFLSTLSLRRATPVFTLLLTTKKHFYPRSPCGERHSLPREVWMQAIISIHALLAESDAETAKNEMHAKLISIHALLAESDHTAACVHIIQHDFYPRSPCGERPAPWACVAASSNFYPRSPCGERRMCMAAQRGYEGISIHALLAESDPQPPPNPR